MIYGERPPHPALSGLVRCFWWLRSVDTHPGPDLSDACEAEGILPDGCPELILNLAEPFRRWESGSAPVLQPRAMLVGNTTRPMAIAATGTIDLVAVRFEPAGAHAFLRLDMCELTDGYVDLDRIGGGWRMLLDRLAGIREPGRRLLALERHLRKLRPQSAKASPVAAVAALLRDGVGRTGVDEAVAAVGIGSRQLRRRFAQEVGVGPKTLSRIFRFQRFLALSTGELGVPLSHAAFLAGYHDQSHVARDFRSFADDSPARFLGLDHELADLFTDAAIHKRSRERNQLAAH